MSSKDAARADQLRACIQRHSMNLRPLPGVADPKRLESLVMQLVDSIHRVEFPGAIGRRDVSPRRSDPEDPEYFDPIRAAAFHLQKGDVDEASWLVFLFVHFGKHKKAGYRYARDVYGRLGKKPGWTWRAVARDVSGFLRWLDDHWEEIRDRGPGGFGNHRKYESLKPAITGAAVGSYVEWVLAGGGHESLFRDAIVADQGDGGRAFARLFAAMESVTRFGRTARFDYLTMIGKLGIAPIYPKTVELSGSTGPLKGARLLYGDDASPPSLLEAWLSELDADLQVGPQALEDAICNWQKSPDCYVFFRG